MRRRSTRPSFGSHGSSASSLRCSTKARCYAFRRCPPRGTPSCAPFSRARTTRPCSTATGGGAMGTGALWWPSRGVATLSSGSRRPASRTRKSGARPRALALARAHVRCSSRSCHCSPRC
eukprot:Amastigsp_a2993_21.p3 type:complete len:120 gc:universal Amastigsp_a2993_21:247-606(+)